jgi:NUMOD1 domain
MKNFSLAILEYSDSKNLILCEQKWISYLKPEYNIKFIKINTKDSKYIVENKKHLNNGSFYCKKQKKFLNYFKTAVTNRNKLPVFGLEVNITDIKTKKTTIYTSIRKAAKAIGSDIKTILRREKSQIKKGINTPYRKRFLIVIKR